MVLSLEFSEARNLPAPLAPLPTDTAITAAVGQVNSSLTMANGDVYNTVDVENELVTDVTYLGYYDNKGRLMNAGESVADYVQYCDYPGERIMKSTKFTVNGNPLDDYDNYTYVFERNFKLKADKKVAYDRAMGQETATVGKSMTLANGKRYGSLVFDGLQTPKPVQPAHRTWQKLLFWFNKDFALALPSAAIPFGQRFVEFELEATANIVFRAPAVWSVVQLTKRYVPGSTFTKEPAGTYDLTGLAPTRNTVYQYAHLPVLTGTETPSVRIASASLYVNNIFVLPVIHDLFMKRVGFSLIRLHRIQSFDVSTAQSKLQMNNFKYPIEYIYAGLIPIENLTGKWSKTDWHQFSKMTRRTDNGPTFLTANGTVFDMTRQAYTEKTRTIDTLGVTAHGTSLYQQIEHGFYNTYTPQAFGRHTLTAPEDPGLAFINFALHPGVYQPSGYINVSRAREFYLEFTSSVVGSNVNGSTVQGKLLTQATALNFLVIADGTAILRYST